MYRVSPFVRRFAYALISGIGLATLWVNLSPASYYDALEWRLIDLDLPRWLSPLPISVTPMLTRLGSADALLCGLHRAKSCGRSLVLSRGSMSGRRAMAPVAGILGGALGAILIWTLVVAP